MKKRRNDDAVDRNPVCNLWIHLNHLFTEHEGRIAYIPGVLHKTSLDIKMELGGRWSLKETELFQLLYHRIHTLSSCREELILE